jgi:hypothetical protein
MPPKPAWNFKDLVGQRFGKLCVVELVPKEERPAGKKGSLWKCLCDCGGTCIARAGDLQQGRINSCKCIRNTLAKMTPEEKVAHRRSQRNKFMRRYHKKWRENHPLTPLALRFTAEELAVRKQQYSEAQRRDREHYGERRRCWKHGITLDEYQQMLDKQGGGCAICAGPSTKSTGAFDIDHDHDHCSGGRGCPKCFRGLLCSNCNWLLGSAADSIDHLQAAIDYLKKWQALAAKAPEAS